MCGRLHHVSDSCCVCRVSGVEESVKVIKQQCESTDGLAVCVQGVSSGKECDKTAV